MKASKEGIQGRQFQTGQVALSCSLGKPAFSLAVALAMPTSRTQDEGPVPTCRVSENSDDGGPVESTLPLVTAVQETQCHPSQSAGQRLSRDRSPQTGSVPWDALMSRASLSFQNDREVPLC